MDKFQSLQLFVRVVENGSFSRTASEFLLTQPSVSKQVSELEAHLKTKLLSRTTRSLSLTEAGEKFYQQAKSILEHYNQAVGEITNLKQKPAGTIRLTSPTLFGRKYITPTLSRFNELYPDIVIEHHLGDSFEDLTKDGIDLSIRLGAMDDSTHQARKLASIQYVTVASKEFVKKHGMPKHPRDLERLPCVIYLGFQTPFKWGYIDKGKAISVNVSGPYRVTATEGVHAGVLSGLGICRVPISAFAEEIRSGKVINLFPASYDTDRFNVYAVTPASAYVPQKTRVMIDFLAEQFKLNPLFSDYKR